MWIFVVSCLVLFPIFWKLYGSKNHKLKKKWNVFKLSANAVLDFMFRMKSEDRLNAFRKIHFLYPKFLHISFFKIQVLVVYDPEIAKK